VSEYPGTESRERERREERREKREGEERERGKTETERQTKEVRPPCIRAPLPNAIVTSTGFTRPSDCPHQNAQRRNNEHKRREKQSDSEDRRERESRTQQLRLFVRVRMYL